MSVLSCLWHAEEESAKTRTGASFVYVLEDTHLTFQEGCVSVRFKETISYIVLYVQCYLVVSKRLQISG